MGTDATEEVDSLPYHYSFKVHNSMCMELKKFVDRIEKVFPEIEAARPRCSSGIQSLCLLNSTIAKSKQILQYCRESSKLYLVITGDVMVSRCQRSKKNFQQSLGQIQTMVPTMLSAEVSQIIDDLDEAKFVLDSSDEAAGKAIRELIQQGTSSSDSVGDPEMEALQFAASRLHITSQEAIMIEKKSIKKLLDKVGDNDPTKKKILKYLAYLLKKYGHLIMKEQTENPQVQQEKSVTLVDSTNISVHISSVEVGCDIRNKQHAAAFDILSSSKPPEQFKCPISMRVMYDPVVIASGQSFERMWIQKWFDEGNDTCPKTKVKLPHRTITPNTAMKDLISKWCERYGVTISDPSIQEQHSLDISSTSIASLGISMNDLQFPLDISNVSLGSLDASYSLDSSRTKVADGFSLMSTPKSEDCRRFQSYACETEAEFLNGLSTLQWESQVKMVEETKNHLLYNDQACHSLSSGNFVKPLIGYLRDACTRHDVKAQESGVQLLLIFVRKNRNGISYLHEDVLSLLVSFLDSDIFQEALDILEVLSIYPYCRSKIAASGALIPILKILDSQSNEFQEQAIRILHNLSSSSEICSQIAYLDCIPKLVPFINDSGVVRHCIALLKNLCDTEEARVSVAETNGCIDSISQLLERGGRQEQEHAVAVLLSLCSQRVQYCHLVMEEGVIPSLVDISVNGTENAKVMALELLRQLRDIKYDREQEPLGTDLDAGTDASQQSKEKKSSSKPSAFFRLRGFSKPSSFVPKMKRWH